MGRDNATAEAKKQPVTAPRRFKLQPLAREAWEQFTDELENALAALEEDEYLIVSIKNSNRYVQFAAQGKFGMRAEATSNYYLPDGQSLNEAQHKVLIGLGWNPPNKLPPEFQSRHDPDGGANYYLDIAAPVPYDSLASLTVSTVHAVFRAPHPGELQYSAFSRTGTEIRIAGLGIKRKGG